MAGGQFKMFLSAPQKQGSHKAGSLGDLAGISGHHVSNLKAVAHRLQ